jgi:hypothetical protein
MFLTWLNFILLENSMVIDCHMGKVPPLFIINPSPACLNSSMNRRLFFKSFDHENEDNQQV